jgi:phosphoenolpyruvate synthase/pyruvate phosphate dikinase
MAAILNNALPRDTYTLSSVPPAAARNKLSNLQLLASYADELDYAVPKAHVLSGQHFIDALEAALPGAMASLLPETLDAELAHRLQQSLLVKPLPTKTVQALRAINAAFQRDGKQPTLCVRSCFELEDQDRQSFAGAFETVHTVQGIDSLCSAVQVVYASVFSERALAELQGISLDTFPAMSVAVQLMVGGEGWLGGVAHTQAPDLSPHPLMLLSVAETSAAVTAGTSIPEDYLIHRDFLSDTDRSVVIQRQAGTRTAQQFALEDSQVRQLATTLLHLEERFESPLEVEWLLDPSARLHLLQARSAPHGTQQPATSFRQVDRPPLAQGLPVGHGTVVATIFNARSVIDAKAMPNGAILVTDNTDPEWVPAIRRAAGIVTRIGARTSHVARTARESGVLAVVGCGDAIRDLRDGQQVTLVCAEGLHGAVFDGSVETTPTPVSAESVCIRHLSEAFALARSCRPRHVRVELGATLTAYRLPPPGTVAESLPPRLRRRIAGYPSVDTFVHAKLMEMACLVAIAFPRAEIALTLPATSPWLHCLPAVAGACRREFGINVALASPGPEGDHRPRPRST